MNATWSSRVTMGLIEACRERDMSFGYIEFLGRGWVMGDVDGMPVGMAVSQTS